MGGQASKSVALVETPYNTILLHFTFAPLAFPNPKFTPFWGHFLDETLKRGQSFEGGMSAAKCTRSRVYMHFSTIGQLSHV